MEITVTLVGADEIIQKLETIKKLLDEIQNTEIQIEVKGQ